MTALRTRTVPPPPEPTPVSKGGLPRGTVGFVVLVGGFFLGVAFFAILTLGVR